MNYFNNIVGNLTQPAAQDMKAQLKKREEMIKKLQNRVKQVIEEKDFVNKSFQDLEKRMEDIKREDGENKSIGPAVQQYIKRLQDVPDSLLQSLTECLLQHLRQHVGEQLPLVQPSILDLDLDYRSLFKQHIQQIFSLAKQDISSSKKLLQTQGNLQIKLQNKDKEIQELIDNYQKSFDQMREEHDGVLDMRLEEFKVVKEQKDEMIREISRQLSLKITQNEQLSKIIGTMKGNEGQLKLQKQKMQKKLYGQCEINSDLGNKIKGLESELKEWGEWKAKQETSKGNSQELKIKCQSLQNSVKEKDNQLVKLKQIMINVKDKISKLNLKQLKQQINLQKETIQKYQSDMSSERQKIGEELGHLLGKIENNKEDSSAKIVEKQVDPQIEKRLEEQILKVTQLESKITQLNNQISNLTEQVITKQKQIKQLKDDAQETQKQNKMLIQNEKTLEQAIVKLKVDIVQKQKQSDDLLSQNFQQNEENKILSLKLTQFEQERKQLIDKSNINEEKYINNDERLQKLQNQLIICQEKLNDGSLKMIKDRQTWNIQIQEGQIKIAELMDRVSHLIAIKNNLNIQLTQLQEQYHNITTENEKIKQNQEQKKVQVDLVHQKLQQEAKCLAAELQQKSQLLQKKEYDLEQSRVLISRLEDRLKVVNQSINEQEGEKGAYQTSMHMIQEMQQKYKSEIVSKTQNIIHLQRRIKQLTIELDNSKQNINNLTEQIQNINTQNKVKTMQIKQNQAEISDLLKQQKNLQKQKQQVFQRENQLIILKDRRELQLTQMKQQKQQIQDQLQQISRQIQFSKEKSQKQEKNWTEEIASLKQKLIGSQNLLTLVNEKYETIQEEISNLKKINDELKEESLRKQNIALKNEQNLQQVSLQMKVRTKQLQEEKVKVKNLITQIQKNQEQLRIDNKKLDELTNDHKIFIINSQEQIKQITQQLQDKTEQVITLKKNVDQLTLTVNEKENKNCQLEELIKKQIMQKQTIQKQNACSNSKIEDLEGEKTKFMEEVKQLKSKIEFMTNELDEKKQQYQKITENTFSSDQLLTQKNQELSLLKQTNKQLELKKENLIQQKETLETQLTSLSKKLSESQQKLKQYQNDLNNKQFQLKEKEDLLANSLSKLEEKQKQISQINNKAVNNRNKLSEFEGQLKNISLQLNQKEGQLISINQQLTSTKQILENTRLQNSKLSINMTELQNQLESEKILKSQALQDQQFMSEVYKDFQSREQSLRKTQHRLSQLQSMTQLFFDTLHKDFNKESIKFIKQSTEMLNQQLRNSKDEYQKIRQELEEQVKRTSHFENNYNLSKTTNKQLELTKLNLMKQLQKNAEEAKNKDLERLNQLNRRQQALQKYKQEVQGYKGKLSKKQGQISKYSVKISDYEDKIKHMKANVQQKQGEVSAKDGIVAGLKSQIQVLKGRIVDGEREIEKVRGQIERVNVQAASTIKKELTTKDQQFKQEKHQIEHRYQLEIKKRVEAMEAVKKQKDGLVQELSSSKTALLDQRKNSARLQAELLESKNDIQKFSSLKSASNQIQQKMLLKDEEIKKCFSTIQSLKNTMVDLQQGIQTYQSMAEEKERQVEQERGKGLQLQGQVLRLGHEIERLERKVKDSRLEARGEIMLQQKMSPKEEKLSKKEESVLPLKLLFLKYFESTSTYESKIKTFNTLCQALSLTPSQLQKMNQYKRTKLQWQTGDRKQKQKRSIQNKFLDFLTAD